VRPYFRITHDITVGNVDFSRELTHMILDGLKKMTKKDRSCITLFMYPYDGIISNR